MNNIFAGAHRQRFAKVSLKWHKNCDCFGSSVLKCSIPHNPLLTKKKSMDHHITHPSTPSLNLNCQGCSRSILMTQLDSPYMLSNWCLTVTYGLTQLLCETKAFKILVTLNLTLQGHTKTNLMAHLGSACMTSY